MEMKNWKASWQVTALVMLGVLWLSWRWVGMEWYDTRTYEPADDTAADISDDGQEVPVWADIVPEWPEGDPEEVTDFTEARMERERSRSLIMEVLSDIVLDSKTDDLMRREAQHRLIALAEAHSAERETEQVLRAQGWGEVMCYVYPGSAVVVTRLGDLSPADSARVIDLVASVTGLGWDSITIISAGP